MAESKDAQALLAAIVEYSHDAIYTKTLGGIVTSWNRAAERIYGYTAAEVVGKPVHMLAGEAYRAELDWILLQVSSGHAVNDLTTERRNKDGTTVHLSVTASPVRDGAGKVTGASVIARDITEKRRAEEQLKRSASELRSIMEAIPEVVWTAGPNCRLEFRNQRWKEHIDVPPDKRAEDVWQDAVHPDDLLRVLAQWERALKHVEAFQCEFRVRTIEGVYRSFLTRAMPVQHGAGTPRWFGTTTDVEDLKRAQSALIATEKLASAGRMAGTIAHEINNPLQAIGDLVFLLSHNASIDETGRSLVQALHEEVQRISHITRQTLGLYREATLPVEVNLREALDDVLDLHKRKLMAKAIHVQRWFQGHGRVRAFPVELRQVFSNLVDNAVDAMAHGGKLEVILDEIEDGSARVRVRDDGSGIPETIRQRIFDPFFSTKGEKGTGVGLWVTWGIVAKHGGTIRVKSDHSENRHGTEFEVVLPVNAAGHGSSAALAANV